MSLERILKVRIPDDNPNIHHFSDPSIYSGIRRGEKIKQTIVGAKKSEVSYGVR
jgi:hypothetical protein